MTAFTLGSNWMALTQTGYDLTNNTNGILVKTAGYPDGFSGATTFGTITFYAKNSGNGAIKIGNSSLAFEANSQNVVNGNGTTFVVSAAAAVTPKTTAPVVQVATNTPTQVTQSAPITQVAAVAGAGASSYSWLWWILLILVAAVVVWWIYVRRSDQNK